MTGPPAGVARARFARVQAAMARHDVGALLLAAPHHGAAATGVRRVQVAGGSGGLPWVVIVAGADAPVVFTPDPDGAPAWVPRAQVEPLRWDRALFLARLRVLVGPTRGAVACDVFAPALVALAEELGRALVDAAPLLTEASAGKSAGEVAAITAALAGARAGVGAAASAIEPGATPAAARACFAAAMSEHGAGFPLGEGFFWRAGRRLDPDASFATGDVIGLELGLWREGVAGLAGTTAVAGGTHPVAARRRWAGALCALARACRAGTTTAALRAAARGAGATQRGLLAVGLGVGLEPPHVDLDAQDVLPLRAGQVLVLAPVVDGFRATRALVVTRGAPRWIEPAP